MSASTPLLREPRKKEGHPVFFRACHSPWASIDQRTLITLRGLALIYLLVSFGMIIDFEITRNKSGWLVPFKFSNFQYLLQIIYQIIVFCWTFTHLHFPHHTTQSQTSSSRGVAFFSPPRQDSTSMNRDMFSIFYTAVNVFPYVSAFIFWAVLMPQGKAELQYDEIRKGDWFVHFYVFNKWILSSIIAFIEVFFYSSIKRQSPVLTHVIGLSVLSWIYLGWTFVGFIVTDKYVWSFLDHRQRGWGHVLLIYASFTVLVNFFFAVVYGVTMIRETLTAKKHDSKTLGYQQLPQ